MYRDGVPEEDQRRLFQHARLSLAEQDAVKNLTRLGVRINRVSTYFPAILVTSTQDAHLAVCPPDADLCDAFALVSQCKIDQRGSRHKETEIQVFEGR